MIHVSGRQAAEDGIHVPLTARGRAVRDPEPVGRRLGAHPRGLGFEALATTSSGFAFTLGRATAGHAEMAQHVAAIDRATELPVSADLENGYGPIPGTRREAIRRAAEAGAVGGSIEDFDRESRQLYEIEHAVERIRAAVEAAHGLAFPFTLTARAENHIRATPTSTTRSGASGVRGGRRRRPLCAGAAERSRRSARCARRSRSPSTCSRVPGLSVTRSWRRRAADQRRREPHLGRRQGVR